jgi:predicted P-loop ATPase
MSETSSISSRGSVDSSETVAAEVSSPDQFLRSFHGDGLVVLTAIIPDGPTHTETFTHLQDSKILTWIEGQEGQGRNIYHEVNPPTRPLSKKASKTDIAGLAWVHVDLDPAKDADWSAERTRLVALIKNSPLLPTVIVDSGNGFQVFWKLRDTIEGEPENLERFNIAVEEWFDADHCHNIDRIMRVPGTTNFPNKKKRDAGWEPRKAMLLHIDKGRSYEPADFEVFEGPLPGAFRAMLRKDEALRARWEGNATGLKDTTRSGFDFSMVSLLKNRGLSMDDTRRVLEIFEHGKLTEEKNKERYFSRMWKKAKGPSGPAIAGLLTSSTGAPLSNVANIIKLLTADAALQGRIAFNEFSQRMIARCPLPWDDGTELRDWTDTDDIELAAYIQAEGLNVATETVRQGVSAFAARNKFHPVVEYLGGLNWDSTSRIERWTIDHLGTSDCRYNREVGGRWLIGAVARVMKPGCKMDTALILEGPQNLGKSSALRILAVNSEWFTDHMPELGHKDSLEQLQGVWIIELAELDAMRRPEVSRVKSFMSAAVDRFRPSYGRRAVTFPRQCIFGGTVNPQEEAGYLKDSTGNRRFWPIECTSINLDSLASVRDQLWAEAVVAYHRGDPWWLNPQEQDELAAEEQEARRHEDEWEAPVERWIWATREYMRGEDGGPDGFEWHPRSAPLTVTTVAEVLEELFGLQPALHDTLKQKRTGQALRLIGFVKDKNKCHREHSGPGRPGQGEKRRWWRLPDDKVPSRPDDEAAPQEEDMGRFDDF